MTTDNKPLLHTGWMRALLYVVLSLAILTVVSVVSRLLAPAEQEGNSEGFPAFVLIYLLLAIFLVALAFLLRRLVDKQTIRSMGFQWKGYRGHAAAGFFLGILLLCVGSLILVLLQYLFFTGITVNAKDLAYSLLLFIIVALTEEIAFRGYILNNLLQSMNKWLALVISALLFSLFHASNASVSMLALLNIFVAGLLLGINYLFTRNLWFAIFLHFSWNFFQGPILGFEVSGLPLNSLFQQMLKGPELLTGGDFGFEGSLICLLVNTACCILLGSYYAGYRTRTLPEFKH